MLIRRSMDRNSVQGRLGEIAVIEFLQSLGYSIFPASESVPEQTGPRIHEANSNEKTVTPDLLVWDGEKQFWIEVKTKSSFSWNRNLRKWTTGIDTRYLEQYIKVDATTPWRVYVLFIQMGISRRDDPPGKRQPRGVYSNSVRELLKSESHRFGHMVYWTIDSLTRIADLTDGIITAYNSKQL